MLTLSPALFSSKIGGALVGRIEPTLVTFFITPEAAVAFSLTKRAAEVCQMIMDRIVGAVTAGFAHLFAEGDREKTIDVMSTTVSLCFGVGVVGLSVYLVCNRSFVTLWVGSRYYAGNAVTVLVAASILGLVFNNLFSVLLGATGDIAVPSWMMLAEAVCRLLIMAALLPWFGMMGLPLAVLLSSSLFAYGYAWRLHRRLDIPAGLKWSGVPWIAIGSLVAAAVAGQWWRATSWCWFAGVAMIVAGSVLAVLLSGDPGMRTLRGAVMARCCSILSRRTAKL